jgi:hypothetical protein
LRGKNTGRIHLNLLPLLSNGDIACSSLESTRVSHTSRCTWVFDTTIKLRVKELGIGAISPKMVKPQLKGDKVADMIFHNIVGKARCF